MKKYIYIAGGIVAVVGIYLIVNPSENVKNPLSQANKTIQKPLKTKNSIQTLKHIDIKNKIKKQPLIETVSQKNINQNENVSHLVNKESLKQTSQKIATFIGNNNLKSVQSAGNVEIFVSNPPQKSEFAPPSPPTLIKLKFKDKSEVIPLNSNLINANKKVYVVEKKDNKYTQIKEIDTKKLTSFTPPSIGQN